MKKAIAIAVLAIGTLAFTGEPAKTFKVVLTVDQAQKLLYVLDKSNAEHQVVKEVQDVLNKQFQAQLDTTKVKN